MTIRTRALAGVLTVLAGCDAGERTAREGAASASPVVRDSASITIVTNEGPRLTGDRAWRLSAEPAAVYGYDPAGEDGLGQAGWARVLSGDRVAAIDYTTNEIKVFSPDGLVHVLGGEGEGPGEFRGLYWFWRLPGDTLVAYDRSLHRLTRFGPDGAFELAVAIAPAGVLPRIVGVLPEGGFVGVSTDARSWAEEPEGTVVAFEDQFLRLGADGVRLDPIIVLPGDRIRTNRDGQGRPGYGSLFDGFSPGPVSTVGSGRIYHGFSDKNEIRVVAPDIGLVRIIRRTRAPEPVTPDMVQALEDWQRQATAERDPAGLPDLERRLAEARYPNHVPFFDWLLVDAVGNLWVRNHFIPGESTAIYSVFDQAGHWITEVEVPAVGPVGRPAVFDIGDDYVLIRRQDDLGVQSYASYALLKPVG